MSVGLRVHPLCDALPADLDPAVVTAIAMAVREALNNVHRHSGTSQAWLSAAQEDRQIVVRVVDRGAPPWCQETAPAVQPTARGQHASTAAARPGSRRHPD